MAHRGAELRIHSCRWTISSLTLPFSSAISDFLRAQTNSRIVSYGLFTKGLCPLCTPSRDIFPIIIIHSICPIHISVLFYNTISLISGRQRQHSKTPRSSAMQMDSSRFLSHQAGSQRLCPPVDVDLHKVSYRPGDWLFLVWLVKAY